MGKLFGTDGIRGIANKEPITGETAYRLGRSTVSFCQKRDLPALVVTGRDTRASGKDLEMAICEGIASKGGTPCSSGIIPTPGVSFIVKEMKAGAGIVVSASHNPWQYNGFKLFSSTGTKLSIKDEEELEESILSEDHPPFMPLSDNEHACSIHGDPTDRYASFLLSSLPRDFSLKGLKLVMDCANGATYRVAPIVFQRAGADIQVLFSSPDGTNINRGCGSQHTGDLSAEVKRSGADLGIAFDGDGDRLVAVDNEGRPVSGDQILFICARHLKSMDALSNDIVVSTVMSNIGLSIALKKMGIRHVVTDVGDRNVYEEMVRQKAVLGGEDSGHIIFSRYHSTGDGILSALMLLKAIMESKKSLSELAGDMEVFPQVTRNVEVSQKPDLNRVPEVLSVIEDVRKMLGDNGRVLVRYSGTEPLCRVMVEGRNKEEVMAYAESIADVVKDTLGIEKT